MRIGPVELSMPFCQAGLAGYSDRAMRIIARRRGCPYAVSEALLDIIMLRGGEGLRRSIDISAQDHPVAGQIVGSEPEQMAAAASILLHAGYDVIDLNFACPVKKIKNKARGGYMLGDPERARAILLAVRRALPRFATLTISLRRGFDDSQESLARFHQILETAWELDFAAARVHARTVMQKFQGPSSWDFLRQLKERYPQKTIIGSGDVFSAQDAVRMKQETGVDVVWIARGAIGNPWIFRQAQALLAGAAEDSLSPPSVPQQRDALEEHFAIAMEIHGEQLAGRRMRKMGIRYARFHPQAAQVAAEFILVRSLRQWREVLDKWYSDSSAGVWPEARAADLVNGEAE